jgi:predicted dehydrogenase
LASHQWDAVNFAMGMGIPETCAATGGIYYWKDGREVPDVWNVVFDYPSKGMAINYTGDFSTRHLGREMTLCGKNATLVMNWNANSLAVHREGFDPADAFTESLNGRRPVRAAEQGKMPEKLATYTPDQMTPMSGHVQNWVDCMRSRARTRCNEDDGFEDVVTCLMSVASFHKQRMVKWDVARQEIV